jgi:hypothetical protein
MPAGLNFQAGKFPSTILLLHGLGIYVLPLNPFSPRSFYLSIIDGSTASLFLAYANNNGENRRCQEGFRKNMWKYRGRPADPGGRASASRVDRGVRQDVVCFWISTLF